MRPRRDPAPAVSPAVPGVAAGVAAGREVEIRPVLADDGERMRAFLCGLSLHTQTLRFFTGLGRPGEGLVRALLRVDERRDVLLAVHGETVVGHVMGFDRDGGVEISVVVADEWQGRGIGSRLVRRLLHRAEARGAEAVGMDVLAENRKVLSMIRAWWPDAAMAVSAGTVEVVAQLRRRGRGDAAAADAV
ncbi:hypothetical protein GCM10010466_24120 [Planomonospora alba]|uniref:N-acetyltransferase domain-containing protein n=1 Tax=Planomonospora alba TaxID=161354 RepID=A0ABP6N0K6_9ACTN